LPYNENTPNEHKGDTLMARRLWHPMIINTTFWRGVVVLMAILMLILTVFGQAQTTAQEIPSPAEQAQIIEPLVDTGAPAFVTFPQPVYTLKDVVPIRGRVLVNNLQSYYVEFRPLVIDSTETQAQADARPWFPATLPSSTPIADGEIGQGNTRSIPDGVYELRLVVLDLNGQETTVRVSPLRVENNIPSFLITPTPDRPPLLATPTPLAGGASGNTGNTGNTNNTGNTGNTTNVGSPTVTANVDANVRRGDDTRYDRVSYLLQGETATVIGVSSLGSGWFYVELPDGRRGFIAPSTVSVSGNIGGLPLIAPPPPPTPIATATPLATATPIPSGNLLVTGFSTDPSPPVCNEAFGIFINITNAGTSTTSSGFSVTVTDTHIASGTVTQTTVGAVPALEPGANFVSLVYLTVDTFFDEEHRINVVVDSGNAVNETNETDNTFSTTYTLARGGC
jgi:hypothetical protein